MSKAEILSQLAKLAPEERAEIQAKLDELDGDRWLAAEELTAEERGVLDARLKDYQNNPSAGSSLEDVEARVRARLRK